MLNRAVLVGVLALVGLGAGVTGCQKSRRSPLAEAARAEHQHGPEMSRPIPIFNVHDLREGERYYRDALGFKVEWEDGDPPTFGAVSRADARIFMCQGCQGNPGTWISIFVRDVDRLHEELARKDAIVRMPPTDMPWHLREMHVSDRDGNVIRFGSDVEH